MDMGELIDMEYIVFRKLSKKAGKGSSDIAKQDYSLGKLEKYILMPGCSEYQTDHYSKVNLGQGSGKQVLYRQIRSVKGMKCFFHSAWFGQCFIRVLR